MNREERRHPEKNEKDATRPEYEKKLLDKTPPDDDQAVRAKPWRHKKVTADKWNQ